jgi:two-component sensor histidine kinase
VAPVVGKWRAILAAQKSGEIEGRIRRFDGDYRRFLIRVTPLRDDSGNIVRWYGTNTDIEELKQAETLLRASLDEKDALLKEVHHRVKNNLQLISSLLSLQASRIADSAVAELFAESQNRVRSMSMVHENLYRAGRFAMIAMGTHVESLCAHLARAYGLDSRPVELATEIDDIELDLDRAISAGLIINELVSNALKHAFPTDRAGRTYVALKRIAGSRCTLAVEDDGIGLPASLDPQQTSSLGLQLVHDLTRQLHGKLRVKRDGGTAFAIDFDAEGNMNASG